MHVAATSCKTRTPACDEIMLAAQHALSLKSLGAGDRVFTSCSDACITVHVMKLWVHHATDARAAELLQLAV